MPIRQPRARLRTHVGLTCRGRQLERKSVVASLQLTPLIDMLIVMVLFLLMFFSASGEICCWSPTDRLPFARRADPLSRASVVWVTRDTDSPEGGLVTLDGTEMGTVGELLSDESPDWKIYKLTEHLELRRLNWQMSHEGQPFPGTVIIAGDREMDFKVLKKIVYSCGLAGYTDLHLAVQGLGSEYGLGPTPEGYHR